MALNIFFYGDPVPVIDRGHPPAEAFCSCVHNKEGWFLHFRRCFKVNIEPEIILPIAIMVTLPGLRMDSSRPNVELVASPTLGVHQIVLASLLCVPPRETSLRSFTTSSAPPQQLTVNSL